MESLQNGPAANLDDPLVRAAIDNLATRSLIGNGRRQPVTQEMAITIVSRLPMSRIVEIATPN